MSSKEGIFFCEFSQAGPGIFPLPLVLPGGLCVSGVAQYLYHFSYIII